MAATPVEPGAFLRISIQADVPFDANSAFRRAQVVGKRSLEDLLTSTEAAEPVQKKPRREFTVPEVEIQVLIAEGEWLSFPIPRNALHLLSSRFKESSSASLVWEGSQDSVRPFILPAAVQYILQFARLKSGYIEEKEFLTLANLKLMFPADFDEIFYDVVRLCSHYEIHELTQLCAVFIGEELNCNLTEHLPAYLKWAERFDQRDFLKIALRSFQGHRAFRLGLYPALASLVHAEGSLRWVKLIQHCFYEILPKEAEGEEIIEISKCYVALFPRCEAPRGVHSKIASYDVAAIRDHSVRSGRQGNDYTLAFYVTCLSIGFIGSHRELALVNHHPKDRKLSELHGLLSAVFSKQEERIERLRRFHTEYPENIFAMQMLCQIDLDRDDYTACLDLAEEILRLKTDYTPAILARAECYYRRENPGAAEQEVDLALFIDPMDTTTHFVRARFQFFKKEFDAAIWGCTELIYQNDKDVQAWFLRATCYLHQGDLDSALADLKNALILSPGHIDILTNIGKIYLDKNLLDAALNYLNAAVAHPSHDFWTLRTRGECLLKMGNLGEAIADFTRAIALCAGPAPMTHALRAQCHVLTRNIPEALKDIDAALKDNPQCALALQLKTQLPT